MNSWQLIFLQLFCGVQCILFFVSKRKCHKGYSFHLTRWLSLLGMFVWGDVLILSLFWILIGAISLFLQDWLLFLVFFSAFWLIRSLGETLYWFLQQFASKKRDSPDSLMGYSFVKNESIWFIYQVFWQCITVISLVSTVYLFSIWLSDKLALL